MRYTLYFSDEAALDFMQAFMWYEEQQATLGIEFQKRVAKTLHFIQKNPFAFQVRYQNIRIAFTSRFPYGLHFILDGKIIKVIALFHSSRNPTSWEHRLT